jgi:2-polyprenyl-3-methyl-5-hydroxy-6-metoxy-1,4-benzoquinol methylase
MYVDTNRELWNLWTKLNVTSKEYSDLLRQLKAGQTTLEEVELEELNDVAGKTLLHLQCHFGLDTFSWAREGAIVTGVDISEEAIALARSLSQELGIEAEFICSHIYDLPARLSAQFDIVYTSRGVLCWLPDLNRWVVVRHIGQNGALQTRPSGELGR